MSQSILEGQVGAGLDLDTAAGQLLLSPDTVSPLSLGPPHMTRWRQREAVTAAPDDSNRIVLLRDGAVDTTSQVLESQVTCLYLVRSL